LGFRKYLINLHSIPLRTVEKTGFTLPEEQCYVPRSKNCWYSKNTLKPKKADLVIGYQDVQLSSLDDSLVVTFPYRYGTYNFQPIISKNFIIIKYQKTMKKNGQEINDGPAYWIKTKILNNTLHEFNAWTILISHEEKKNSFQLSKKSPIEPHQLLRVEEIEFQLPNDLKMRTKNGRVENQKNYIPLPTDFVIEDTQLRNIEIDKNTVTIPDNIENNYTHISIYSSAKEKSIYVKYSMKHVDELFYSIWRKFDASTLTVDLANVTSWKRQANNRMKFELCIE